MHKAFYGKCNGIFRVCASSVYQASPQGEGGRGGGGEGPGDEARPLCVHLTSSYVINGKQGLTKQGRFRNEAWEGDWVLPHYATLLISYVHLNGKTRH